MPFEVLQRSSKLASLSEEIRGDSHHRKRRCGWGWKESGRTRRKPGRLLGRNWEVVEVRLNTPPSFHKCLGFGLAIDGPLEKLGPSL